MMIPKQHILSKSTFMYGTQCPKRLWLHNFKPELRDKVNETQQSAFHQGNKVTELAYKLFPQGVSAKSPNHSYQESIIKTQEYIANGYDVIYEAAFQYDGVLTIIDLLVKEQGKWYAYEVKSSTVIKQEHTIDAAFQYYVITNSGIDLKDFFIVRINPKYVYMDRLKITSLFAIDSILILAQATQANIINNINEFKRILQSEIEPVFSTGKHCNKHSCNFQSYCQYKKTYINQVEINKKELKNFLFPLKSPLYFMDFESWSVAVPEYNHQWPYRQMPFQFSVHKQQNQYSSITHFEYLAEFPSTPHLDFAINLIKVLGTEGSILVYNKSFENTILEQIKKDFPEFYSPISEIQGRLVDLMIPFKKKYYYTPSMRDSYSIKYVLPALVKNFTYQGMEISNGAMASQEFYKLQTETDPQIRESIRNALLEYCKLDTLAMVEILKNIRSQIES
ncbi:MAG: DUF2779 domain-containing protein [Planktothrix sp.]